ncbi:hypothetical protein AB1Y20_004860 [Prymnesium parvum]|uniref:Uncharacterized protein n=1 Tax=Prymnesium parvum TaxID=97485 RepID=A0AB34IXX6_PRYPA
MSLSEASERSSSGPPSEPHELDTDPRKAALEELTELEELLEEELIEEELYASKRAQLLRRFSVKSQQELEALVYGGETAQSLPASSPRHFVDVKADRREETRIRAGTGVQPGRAGKGHGVRCWDSVRSSLFEPVLGFARRRGASSPRNRRFHQDFFRLHT